MNRLSHSAWASAWKWMAGLSGIVLMLSAALQLFGGEPPKPTTSKGSEVTSKVAEGAAKDALVPLNKNGTVLLDKAGKRLLLKTHVVLREGLLEQFTCLKQTKEHESILALDAKAYTVHAGLLALGAKIGTPVRFAPEYKAPSGERIDIFVSWTDEQGKQKRVPAQNWVRKATHRFFAAKLEMLPAGLKIPENSELRYDGKLKELSWYGPMTVRQKDEFLALSTDKEYRKVIESFYEQGQSHEMKANWVFSGSGFYKDEDTKKEYYLAEDGDLICVANFPGATIDVAVPSTSQGDDLLFEAYTERIPPKETPVTVELIPVVEKDVKRPEK